MSDITDGVGTAVEGALLGRAVEPDNGENTVDMEESLCLNCGAALVGSHCHSCGQKAKVHRTISAFMHDLLHGALHFEGKIWHTLPLLIRRPGELTRRYIEGERAKFVSPMALFLFFVFLMFATFQMAGLTASTDIRTASSMQQGFDDAIIESREEVREAEERLNASPPDDPAREELVLQLEAKRAGLSTVEAARAFAVGEGPIDAPGKTGVALIDKAVGKWSDNPGLMLYKLQANFYKFSWLLIPLSIPFVWLLFAWRREYRMYDHAVFVTYSLSFVTLMFVTFSLIGLLLPGLAGVLVFAGLLVPVWHIRKQLRGAYAISRWGSIWRTFVLLFFISIILALFLNLLMLLGIMG